MYLDKAKKEEIFSKYGKSNSDTGSAESQIALFSIATVPSSRPSVSASNLEQFAKKTFNPITLAENDGIFYPPIPF